jgi:hypothetical protein
VRTGARSFRVDWEWGTPTFKLSADGTTLVENNQHDEHAFVCARADEARRAAATPPPPPSSPSSPPPPPPPPPTRTPPPPPRDGLPARWVPEAPRWSTLLPEGQLVRERELQMLVQLARLPLGLVDELMEHGASVPSLVSSSRQQVRRLAKRLGLSLGSRLRLVTAVTQHLHRGRAEEADGADDGGEAGGDDDEEDGDTEEAADGDEPRAADAAAKPYVVYDCVGERITRTEARDGRLHVWCASSGCHAISGAEEATVSGEETREEPALF